MTRCGPRRASARQQPVCLLSECCQERRTYRSFINHGIAVADDRATVVGQASTYGIATDRRTSGRSGSWSQKRQCSGESSPSHHTAQPPSPITATWPVSWRCYAPAAALAPSRSQRQRRARQRPITRCCRTSRAPHRRLVSLPSRAQPPLPTRRPQS